MAEGNKIFPNSLGVVGEFGFIKYNTDPFGKSFNGLINAQSYLSKRCSIGDEARITVYGLIGDKDLVKIFEKAYDRHENNAKYASRELADSYGSLKKEINQKYKKRSP